jgi:flagellar basal body-associated protein FliL
MEKVISIISVINRVFITLILIITVLLTTSVAYIIFAPDDFPKPFYIQYFIPTAAPMLESGEPILTPTPAIEVKPGEGIMVDTGAKIINLRDDSNHKYIRASIVLEFAPDSPDFTSTSEEVKQAYLAAFNTEITAKVPIINDVIITLLSTKSYEELYTAQGKETVRKEIIDEVNKRMAENQVISVYFTEFVIE